ncbi:MAG: D-alanine--D-alanine ligase [Candidatus Marinimicrobia bacterium]|nr:D-alanine--D-alanine ligase [Candidatus Neomarinimicrobiota bacterium]|tara:strand:+ start:26 stop:943 length:918 start_codon:yes stop_codon:yes gene_type:complete
MNSLKLAIIYGGSSSERDVSIDTAKSIISVLDDDFEITKIDFDGNIRNLDNLLDGLSFDLIFNALHGGVGENGLIQKYFEDNKIPFTGSGYNASHIAMNKHQTKLECLKLDIPTPKWKLLDDVVDYSTICHEWSNISRFALKPNDEGSSTDLFILDFDKNIVPIQVCSLLEKYSSCLIEEYIKGRELTVGILGNQVLPIVEILPKNNFYDYECKYSQGMSKYQVPAHLSSELASRIQYYAYKLHASLGCRHYGRVDFRLDNNNDIYLLEINTLPGMTSTSLLPKAAKEYGISFKSLIRNIINQAL